MRFYSEEYKLYYEKYDDHVAITEMDRNVEKLSVPDVIDNLPVTVIGKKAFLSQKLLKEVILPASVKEIGDFAFAMCDRLMKVILPSGAVKLGANLFKNDFRLDKLYVNDESEDAAASLMAAAPIVMEADYLIDTQDFGSKAWYSMWDGKLRDILSRKDDEGYHLYVLCGEEDLHFDYDQYIEYIREKKSGLCILRLMNRTMLDKDVENEARDYLMSQVMTSEANNPVFNYCLKNHPEEEKYYELLINEGVLTSRNREALLLKMGDRHPQMKAYIINAFDKEETEDFFEGLSL